MRVLYQPYSDMKAGPFRYIEVGYVRGLKEIGCDVRIWGGVEESELVEILREFRPNVMIGFLRGGSTVSYRCCPWTRPPLLRHLIEWRRISGMRVAMHTHPDVGILNGLIGLDIPDVDTDGNYQYYLQPQPPLPEESRLTEVGFIDLILHSFSSQVNEACFPFWRSSAVKVQPDPLAADTTQYYLPPTPQTEAHAIGFVGGWWPFKGEQIDPFIEPLIRRFAEEVVIYGRNWPYASRGELLDEDFNRFVWSTAVNLTFHEPSQVRGYPVHVNERVFKLLACGAFVIGDNNPCLREYFAQDELVCADSPSDLLGKIEYFLERPDERRAWAERGYQAVTGRHTYAHRARAVLESLDAERPEG